MGSWTSRQNAGVEEVDVASNHAYKYPPRSGNYFGSHFIMGGERFDTPQPEAYLFGENADLNFLGSRPTPFPYPPPQANEPTKTLKSLVNIRKESLRFVRAPPDCGKENNRNLRDIEAGKSALYNIEFTFDCDVRCAITIYYFCSEEITSNGVIFSPKDPSTSSETFHYKKGANQQFCQPLHVFDPTKYSDDELLYNPDKEVIPIAIHCVAEEGSEDPKQSHTTIAVVEKHTDGTYVLKALKQKLFLDGLCYLLQEIYGIENKNNENKNLCDDDMEDNGSECVICMCDTRDTLILPCRHLCLCNSCADSLRYQANNCPICRAPFRALLQIRALLKTHNVLPLPPSSPPDGSLENIPAGYEQIPLIEALNGPCQTRQPPSAPGELVETPEAETAIQAAEILNRSSLERTSSKNSPKDNGNRKAVHDKTPGASSTTPEFHMTVLMQREDNAKETPQSPLLAQSGGNKINGNQTNGQRSNKCTRPRDSLRLINEKAALEKDENQDEDSECEKLSPLLDNAQKQVPDTDMTALRVDATLDPIDTDTEHDDDTLKTTVVKDKEKQSSHKDDIIPPPPLQREERADDSDYYTPEEPVPTALSPLYTAKERPNTAPPSGGPNSIETTPLRHPLGVSLPSTPLSHVSGRSSGDSYSSSSSTRHLLAVACSNEDNEKAVAI